MDYSGEEDDLTLLPQTNYNGWVNPEDLASMPQCIAQQDQSTWLDTMTRCTKKQCTSHFGLICTHHQWLTQLGCLSAAFSSAVIESYYPYCARSILAKAQLYLWVRTITGRAWLVDVGDANGLGNLSPASLADGYATVDVNRNAPTCLIDSVSARSTEPFQHVMASCSFTGTTQHTGNAARPWEYSESLHSMVALDLETAGYDLVGHQIRDGDYFDKDCVCSTFNIDPEKEPCSGSGQLDLTRERLWINATCGPTSLPDNWTGALKTTQFAYIPVDDWRWPICVADIPKEVIELPDHCTTDACEVDSAGYCNVKRAVDRACFCRDISYNTCQGSCHVFETRIDYIKWLHDLCGNVQDWHGLPDNWRQLAAPTPTDMIPWRWTIKPAIGSDVVHMPGEAITESCASNAWKLGSFVLANIATFLVALLGQRMSIRRTTGGYPRHSHPESWLFKGTFIAALSLLANCFNVWLVQRTSGYEDVPVGQLMLLWCSMPRLAPLMILLIGSQPLEIMKFSQFASLLFAETILQLLSSYYMIVTVNYGYEHSFYLGGIEGAERGGPAKIMYAGALMWLIIGSLTLVHLPRAMRGIDQAISEIAEEPIAPMNEYCAKSRAHHWVDKSKDSEDPLLTSIKGRESTAYGTFSDKGQQHQSVSREASVQVYAAMVITMLLLWVAQWLFWGGFIGLSSEEFCPPKLGALTAVWVVFSSASAIFGFIA